MADPITDAEIAELEMHMRHPQAVIGEPLVSRLLAERAEMIGLLRTINSKTLLPELNNGEWGDQCAEWLDRRDALLSRTDRTKP